MEIRYVKNGLANNFNSYIELNEDLKDFPKLHYYVLNHELNHTDQNFSLKDLINELRINPKLMIKLISFVLLRPKTWIDFLPVYYKEKTLIYDLPLIFLYSISIILIIILFLIIKKVTG